MPDLHQQLTAAFPNLTFQSEHPLAPHTTVKIGGPAEVYCETQTTDEFIELVTFAKKNSLPLTLLGWGSNTLIADRGIRGLVVKNKAQEITTQIETKTSSNNKTKEEPARWGADQTKGSFKYDFGDLDYDESHETRVEVRIASGVSLPLAINTLISQGITGLQWFSRIPGSIGGAIYNNIHGGTHFIGEVVKSVRVIDSTGKLLILEKKDLAFGYDISRFHNTNEVIVDADFLLYRGDTDKARQVAQEWAVRKKLQPQNSLGCIFQNITANEQKKLDFPTPSVGYIVEHILERQDLQIGGAKVSDHHAAFIENTGTATASDYLAVIRTIIKETKLKTGLVLKPEIFFLGFTKEELKGVTHE